MSSSFKISGNIKNKQTNKNVGLCFSRAASHIGNFIQIRSVIISAPDFDVINKTCHLSPLYSVLLKIILDSPRDLSLLK